MKILRLMGLLAVLSMPYTASQAAIISADDWWLTTDNGGGLRQSTWNSDFYFAVSQFNTWNPNDIYLAPNGYRVATTAEGQAAFNGGNISSYGYTYYNQNGWSGYVWEGLTRYRFRFSDSATTNAYKHAGNFDPYYVQFSATTTNFAGMVLIKDETAVSAPATALLLMTAGGFILRRRRRAANAV